MSSRHTPGPWKTGDCDGFIIWAGGWRSVKWAECEPGPEAVHIADAACPGWALRPEIEAKLSIDELMNREDWVDECRANARLIAVAPEFYEHADAAVRGIQKAVLILDLMGRGQDARDLAVHANNLLNPLRKARGEQ